MKATAPRPPAALPTIERLREVLTYHPNTGRFTWAINRPKCIQGALAGSMRQDGFRAVSVDRFNMLASRVAWAMSYGRWPDTEVTHLNGNRADDRLINLSDQPRDVIHANRTRPDRDSRAPALGVRQRGGKWHARFNGKHLGTYATAEEAHAAYLAHKQSTGKIYRT